MTTPRLKNCPRPATVLAALLLATLPLSGHSAGPADAPDLPPQAHVIEALSSSPMVRAAGAQIEVEEARSRRLEAGPHEWTVRLSDQQRRVRPASAGDEQFNEWNAAIERPLRLPGKGALDAELGAGGVALLLCTSGCGRGLVVRGGLRLCTLAIRK